MTTARWPAGRLLTCARDHPGPGQRGPRRRHLVKVSVHVIEGVILVRAGRRGAVVEAVVRRGGGGGRCGGRGPGGRGQRPGGRPAWELRRLWGRRSVCDYP